MAGAGLNFRSVRSKADLLDDANPNVAPPAETDIFKPSPYRSDVHPTVPVQGFRARLVYTTAGTCVVNLWVRNGISGSDWSPAGSISGVQDKRVFGTFDVGDAHVFFQLTSIGGGAVAPISVQAEEA